jgi:hypothetical protein
LVTSTSLQVLSITHRHRKDFSSLVISLEQALPISLQGVLVTPSSIIPSLKQVVFSKLLEQAIHLHRKDSFSLIIVLPLLAVAELELEQAAFFEGLRNYRHHHRTNSSLAAIWL